MAMRLFLVAAFVGYHGLKVVVCSSNVARGGHLVMFAGRMSFGVGHDVLPVSVERNRSGLKGWFAACLAIGMETVLNRLAEVVESVGTLASLQFGHGRERRITEVGRLITRICILFTPFESNQPTGSTPISSRLSPAK